MVHTVYNVLAAIGWGRRRGASFSGGSGAKDDPYLIANILDLAAIPHRVFGPAHDGLEYRAAHYRQTADIDISLLSDMWVPIGYAEFSEFGGLTADFSFTGAYDGDGHKITGFKSCRRPFIILTAVLPHHRTYGPVCGGSTV